MTLVGSTLPFTDANYGGPIAFTVNAVNDDLLDSSETIVATLSAETIDEGTASITTASDSVNITDIDEAISFSIAADVPLDQRGRRGTATFTITLSGFPLNTGNSATVDVAVAGTATAGPTTRRRC